MLAQGAGNPALPENRSALATSTGAQTLGRGERDANQNDNMPVSVRARLGVTRLDQQADKADFGWQSRAYRRTAGTSGGAAHRRELDDGRNRKQFGGRGYLAGHCGCVDGARASDSKFGHLVMRAAATVVAQQRAGLGVFRLAVASAARELGRSLVAHAQSGADRATAAGAQQVGADRLDGEKGEHERGEGLAQGLGYEALGCTPVTA